MSTRRLSPKPPAKKCKQCGVEKALQGRDDGLGRNCGTHLDAAKKKMDDARAAKKSA